MGTSRDCRVILGRLLGRTFLPLVPSLLPLTLSPKPRQKSHPNSKNSYPNTSIWITEYALNNVSLAETQTFYNTSAQYFDRLNYVEKYSYFGGFRSDVSNVGPNAAMLNNKGELTDIGSWYLGGKATGNKPGGKSGAGRIATGSWWVVVVGLVVLAL